MSIALRPGRGRLLDMSNEQWNQGQRGEWAPQQPESAPEQGQPWTQQGQQSAPEWGQPQAPAPQGNAWTEPQPQRSAQDWTQAQPQASAGDWHQAQQQPASAGEWAQQYQGSAQGWNQNQQQFPPQQGWDHNQQQWGQQGYVPAPQSAGQPQWAPDKPKKPSPFDFSFSKPTLPDAAGTIFLIGSIGIGVWWLFQLLSAFAYVIDFPLEFFGTVIGDAGLAVFGVMVLRALLEVGVAVLRRPADKVDDGSAEDTTAV